MRTTSSIISDAHPHISIDPKSMGSGTFETNVGRVPRPNRRPGFGYSGGKETPPRRGDGPKMQPDADYWSGRPDLNRRPLPPQGSALPPALRPDAHIIT